MDFDSPWFLLGWLLLVIAVQMVITPVMTWLLMRIPADLKLQPPDTKSLVFNPNTQSFLNETTNTLKTLGFEFVAHLETREQYIKGQKNLSILTLMRNPETQAIAEAVTVFVQGHMGFTYKAQVVAISTEYAGGTGIVTKRSKQVETFRKRPQVTSLTYRSDRVPLAEIYRTHLLMARRYGKSPAIDMLENGPIAMMHRGHKKIMEYQAKCWLMKPCRKGQAWRPTVLGACLMTWKLIWPIKGFFILKINRQRRRILKEIAHLEGQVSESCITART